jgi:hypothetical protein
VVAQNLQENTHFSRERGLRYMNWEKLFLYIGESCTQLRRLIWLVIGCHT